MSNFMPDLPELKTAQNRVVLKMHSSSSATFMSEQLNNYPDHYIQWTDIVSCFDEAAGNFVDYLIVILEREVVP